ncbi:hypothetical protein L218DRAFT_805931, partial [Marasmius fiardii PR-910]
EQKKTSLACFFCRGRKMACKPSPGPTRECMQCVKKGLICKYPTESRRGQHRRRAR